MNQLVFAHCDLLSGNVIVLPDSAQESSHSDGNSHSNGNGNGNSNGTTSKPGAGTTSVAFIDYEYATPSPAAFDIANHFAEWGGFDCDFSVLPTRSQRRDFVREYIRSYYSLLPRAAADDTTSAREADGGSSQGARSTAMMDEEREADKLMVEVDAYRGVPGFYWGIWALIQAQISDIDFDYASYAEVRLGEYWAWRAEVDGSREREGKEMPLRERRWAQEE
jgi:ethanolamine kinase